MITVKALIKEGTTLVELQKNHGNNIYRELEILIFLYNYTFFKFLPCINFKIKSNNIREHYQNDIAWGFYFNLRIIKECVAANMQ